MKKFIISTNTDYMLQCLETDELSDQKLILIDSSKKEIVLHVSRLILASKSKYFQCLFSSQFKEQSEKEIKIYVNDVEITRNIIYMMYGKELPIVNLDLHNVGFGDIVKYILELSKYDNEFKFLLMEIDFRQLVENIVNFEEWEDIKFFEWLFQVANDTAIAEDDVDDEEILEKKTVQKKEPPQPKKEISGKRPRPTDKDEKRAQKNQITIDEITTLLSCDLFKILIQYGASYNFNELKSYELQLNYHSSLLKNSIDLCYAFANAFKDAEYLICVTNNGDIYLLDHNSQNLMTNTIGEIPNVKEKNVNKRVGAKTSLKSIDQDGCELIPIKKYKISINSSTPNTATTNITNVSKNTSLIDFQNDNPIIIISSADTKKKVVIFDICNSKTIYSTEYDVVIDKLVDGTTILSANYTYIYMNEHVYRKDMYRKNKIYLRDVVVMFPVKNFIYRLINDSIKIKKLVEM